jgi:hypothetical protein
MGSSGVVAFPLYRQRAVVTALSASLAEKHGEEANLFWRDTAKRHLQQLLAAGVPLQQAEEEVRRLLYVVLDGMHRAAAGTGASK